MIIHRFAILIAAAIVLLPAPAAAQEKGKTGIFMGSSGLGVIWHATLARASSRRRCRVRATRPSWTSPGTATRLVIIRNDREAVPESITHVNLIFNVVTDVRRAFGTRP